MGIALSDEVKQLVDRPNFATLQPSCLMDHRKARRFG